MRPKQASQFSIYFYFSFLTHFNYLTSEYIITVYIHFESIYCIWMVSLFDWQSIAKAGQSVAKHLFGHCNRPASFCNRMQVKKTDHPNAAYRLKVNVDGECVVFLQC